jgi:hypothetical protein
VVGGLAPARVDVRTHVVGPISQDSEEDRRNDARPARREGDGAPERQNWLNAAGVYQQSYRSANARD